jgi:hypothetical protein
MTQLSDMDLVLVLQGGNSLLQRWVAREGHEIMLRISRANP